MVTTSYGSWAAVAGGCELSVRGEVADILGEFATDYDLDAVTADYREAIKAALPEGVSLHGDEFYGPYHEAERRFDGYPTTDDGRLDLAAIIASVDTFAIAARHERAHR